MVDTTIAGALNEKVEDANFAYDLSFSYSDDLQKAAEQVLRTQDGLKQNSQAATLEGLIASYQGFDKLTINGLNPSTPVPGSKTAITVKIVSGKTDEAAQKEAVKNIINDLSSSDLKKDEPVTGNSDLEYRYTYTGNVAVVTAADNGVPVYMAVATVTCTTSAPVEAE